VFTIWSTGSQSLNVSSFTLDMEAPWISWLPAGPIDLDAGAEREVNLSVDWNQTSAGQSTRRVLVESNVANKSPYPDGVYIITDY